MKKITVIILMLVYGLSSSGTTVTADYCCGKISKIAVFLSQAENSKQNKQVANKQCCEHKEVSLKLKTAQQLSGNQTINFSVSSFIQPAFFKVDDEIFYLHKTFTSYSNGPPLFAVSNIFLKNCSFRI